MNKINVLVTSVGGFSHGSSIVKALLQSALPLDIVGTDMSPRLINASPVKKKEIVPGARTDEYIETVLNIIKNRAIDCIFTGSEQELLKIAAHREFIESEGAKVFMNNHDVITLCKNKLSCFMFLQSLGFDIPKTFLIRGRESWESIDCFPVVIKPYLETGASANVFVAKSKDELSFIATYLLNKNIDIIAQEYLPYENNEYTVGVTSLIEEASVISSIALRKFIEGPTSYINNEGVVISSGITQGEFLDFQDIRKQCEAIAAKICSTGPLNIQLRVIDGIVKPFEINPRFSGTTSARAFNGYNEPEFYIRKYILNDAKAKEALSSTGRGFVVKGLDERYISYE